MQRDAVPAGALGAIELAVGDLVHFHRALGAIGERRATNADAEASARPGQFLDAPPDRLGQVRSLRHAGMPQQDTEFLATDAPHEVIFADRVLQRRSNADQRLVALQVTEPIVDLLEVVDIGDQQHRFVATLMGTRELVEEVRAVDQSGHAVMRRRIADRIACLAQLIPRPGGFAVQRRERRVGAPQLLGLDENEQRDRHAHGNGQQQGLDDIEVRERHIDDDALDVEDGKRQQDRRHGGKD